MDLPVKVGQSCACTEDDLDLAERIADAHHRITGAMGTRDAGSNWWLRYDGAVARIGVARMLGVPPQVKILSGPSRRRFDIQIPGWKISVKSGLALVYRKYLLPDILYVAVSGQEYTPGWMQVHHVAMGDAIARRDSAPPRWLRMRPGTREQNYWFGS